MPGQVKEESVFIFLVDRSGSMRGKKMEMTQEALKLFIQSLPPGCLFEIISFGDNFSLASSDKKGLMNNDANVNNMRKHIDAMRADMNGTEIFNPLEYAITKFLKPGQIPLPQQEHKKGGIMGPIREKFMQNSKKLIAN